MTASSSINTHLQSARPPWVVLLTVKPGQAVDKFLPTSEGFATIVLKGTRCRTEAGLFAEFARAMKFPDYFGHNWDALEECLTDLEWLPAKGYILLISDADLVLEKDEEGFQSFVDVLRDAGEAWASGQAGIGSKRAVPFHVICTLSEHRLHSRAHWGGIKELSIARTRGSAPRRRSSGHTPPRR